MIFYEPEKHFVVQVTAPHPHTRSICCAGVLLSRASNRVVSAAHILHYTRGWSLDQLKNYCKTKNWKLEVLNETFV